MHALIDWAQQTVTMPNWVNLLYPLTTWLIGVFMGRSTAQKGGD